MVVVFGRYSLFELFLFFGRAGICGGSGFLGVLVVFLEILVRNVFGFRFWVFGRRFSARCVLSSGGLV